MSEATDLPTNAVPTLGRAVVIGQGYVGLPLAMEAVAAGWDVVGIDTAADRVDGLNAGISHVEDISAETLTSALASGRYRASTDAADAAGFDLTVITVPTPLSEGVPDLSFIAEASTTLGEHLRAGATVVLESTTYPGTTRQLVQPILEEQSGLKAGTDFHLGYSPERIDPGNAKFGLRNTPKVVSGIDAASLAKVQGFYDTVVDRTVAVGSTEVAELTKLLENTFRHVNIALVNEMVRFCRELDIDLWNAIDCAETKPFGFMAFRPGPGVGGHCIPVDPVYLSHRVKAKLGYAFRMVELAEEINHAAPRYVAERVWQLLNERGQAVNGARILLVGVTYKPDVADRRESPADPLALLLAKWGADVRYIDPFVPTWHVTGDGIVLTLESESDLLQAAEGADLVVLLQPHRRLPLAALPDVPVPVLDTRGILDLGSEVTRL